MSFYDHQYSNVLSDSYEYFPNDSLLDLIQLFKRQYPSFVPKKALEVGCGAGLHLVNTFEGLQIDGLDISEGAINYVSKENEGHFYCCDFLNFESERKWDLILDGHLLHCLIGASSFETYFSKVSELLSDKGYLLLEVMCNSRNMDFDEGFYFDERSSVLSDGSKEIRTILTAFEIEQLIQRNGLKIVYLRVDETIKFIPNSIRNESRPSDPDRMRVICLKE
ncbi:class I SAM-dependent methyltransferase [Halobacteriovorax marinus]|uniref:class I SAM-dependent methyltransferase n=1 Tax=Halobacteriovorax marinus TaxID=97084 RepID=UPI003A8CBE89